jgi:hypothetical protein
MISSKSSVEWISPPMRFIDRLRLCLLGIVELPREKPPPTLLAALKTDENYPPTEYCAIAGIPVKEKP